MKALELISDSDAEKIGKRLGIDFNFFTVGEFKEALNLELNAEIKEGEFKPGEYISSKELEAIGRVTMSHINVFVD